MANKYCCCWCSADDSVRARTRCSRFTHVHDRRYHQCPARFVCFLLITKLHYSIASIWCGFVVDLLICCGGVRALLFLEHFSSLKPGTHWRQSWIQHGRLCWNSTVAETIVVVLVLVRVLKESLRTNLKSWSLELKSLSLSWSLTLRSWSWVLVLVLEEKSLVVSLFLVFFSWHLQSRFLRNLLPNTHYMWDFTYLTLAVIVCGKFPFHRILELLPFR